MSVTHPSAEASRPSDPTAAERARRYRANKAIKAAEVVDTVGMMSVAGRLAYSAEIGRVMPSDLRVASRLIVALVHRLPAESTIDIGNAPDRPEVDA